MGIEQIKVEQAMGLVEEILPMLNEFEEQGIDYCLVGGMAVMIHCLAAGNNSLRATYDADVMVSQQYSNSDFAKEYLHVYAADPRYAKAVYDAVIGDEGFSALNSAESAFINVSFIGADTDLDGIDTPDFDVCRTLNGKTLGSIQRERVLVSGTEIWVATRQELLGMKRSTVELYGVGIDQSSRPQDFLDIGSLERIIDNGMHETNERTGLMAKITKLLEDKTS